LFGTRRSLELTVKPHDPGELEAAMDDARVTMRIQRKLRPKDTDNFGLFTSDTLMSLWKTFSQGAFSVLIGLVALSLVVGGIVIMNIMLVSVTERTREIGLRMAVGARGRDILTQFLVEAITLALIGGLLGIVLGVGSTVAIGQFAGWPIQLGIEPVVLAVGFAAAIGIFFGFHPARKASRLLPIEALRYE
jgi:putative ABC transport system permease protein